jgi:hypothetical protein
MTECLKNIGIGLSELMKAHYR